MSVFGGLPELKGPVAGLLCAFLMLVLATGCHPSSKSPGGGNFSGEDYSKDYRSLESIETDASAEKDKGISGNPIVSDKRFLPANHTVDWLARHGQVSRVQSQECASCHTEQDCASCHIEQLAVPFQVHPPNFVTIHSIDARQNLAGCTDCHRVDSFCQQCHMQAKFSPRPTHSPPDGAGFAQMGFHPPGWLDSAQANHHGIMARRNITDCASCHTEQDCVTCHVGINPHPAEFRFECRRWLEANARPCAQCHGDLSALRSLCP